MVCAVHPRGLHAHLQCADDIQIGVVPYMQYLMRLQAQALGSRFKNTGVGLAHTHVLGIHTGHKKFANTNLVHIGCAIAHRHDGVALCQPLQTR